MDNARSAIADLEEAVTPILSRGRHVGPYRLLQLLGRGGMAEVYRAERAPPCPGQPPLTCVVKTMRAEVARVPDLARLFVDEMKLMGLLQHPNIVRTYDQGIADGTLYLAMELLEGWSLSRLLKALSRQGDTLPPALVAHVGAEIAEALAYAHDARDEHGRLLGLVHRDVSPSNVMLLYDGRVKLLDFGIAKLSGGVRSRRRSAEGERIKGKPNYMAPEQLLDQPLDGRADLFSLGVVLWELLTGRPLFNRPTTQEVAAVVLGGDIDPPSSLRPAVPPGLEALVLQALARDPRHRPGSAAELAFGLRAFAPPPPHAALALGQVLQQLGERRPTPAPPPPTAVLWPPFPSPPPAPPRLPAPPRGRGRLRSLLWTLAVAALAFCGGVEWAKRRAAGAPPPVAIDRPDPGAGIRGARIQPLNDAPPSRAKRQRAP